MTQTTIRGQQLRDATVSRGKIDTAFETQLSTIETNIASIFSTMSTDSERLDAVAALTAAFESADGTLQGMITSMVNSTRVGAGLESDGTLNLPGLVNYITGSTSLKGAIVALDAALKTEEGARQAAISTLESSIQDIIDSGASDTQAALAQEVTDRSAADTALGVRIDGETSARTAADIALQGAIDNEITAREDAIDTVAASVASEASARTAAVSGEATARAAADTTLQSNIDAEALARTQADGVHTAAIADEVTNRGLAITAEATTRASADTALDTRVSALEGATTSGLTYDKVVKREAPAGAIDGVNVLFTVAHDVVLGTEEVYYNGQLQEPGVGNDYTISGKEITLLFVPSGTDRVRVSYFR